MLRAFLDALKPFCMLVTGGERGARMRRGLIGPRVSGQQRGGACLREEILYRLALSAVSTRTVSMRLACTHMNMLAILVQIRGHAEKATASLQSRFRPVRKLVAPSSDPCASSSDLSSGRHVRAAREAAIQGGHQHSPASLPRRRVRNSRNLRASEGVLRRRPSSGSSDQSR